MGEGFKSRPRDHQLISNRIFTERPAVHLVGKQQMYLMSAHLVINEVDGMGAATFFDQEKNEEIVLMGFLNISFSTELMVQKATVTLHVILKRSDPEYREMLFCTHLRKIQKSRSKSPGMCLFVELNGIYFFKLLKAESNFGKQAGTVEAHLYSVPGAAGFTVVS